MRILGTSFCLALLLTTALAAQTKAPAAQAPGAADGASVDSILAALYQSVSHGPDAEPDWNRMRGIMRSRCALRASGAPFVDTPT